MEYRRFGRTGLDVSRLAFGGGFVGGLLIIGDDDAKRRVVKRAVAAGINYFDTAPAYGAGKSEAGV